MMRRIFILAASMLTCAMAASAQSLAAFKEQLAQPATAQGMPGSSSVTITEQGDAADAVARATGESVRKRVKGYRVCIFFDNGQNARSGAESARASFAAAFPDVRCHIAYNSPYFTVAVGDCVTAEEAIVLMGRVKPSFPRAFLKSEEIAILDLVK